MKRQLKQSVHFFDADLITATNPVTVNVIGAGGTGSQVITALGRINFALTSFNHPGLQVRLWDDDTISPANQGRQLFADCEVGLHKSVVLINKWNRAFGTNWKAETKKFERDPLGGRPKNSQANIYVSCVDNVSARFEIASIIQSFSGHHFNRSSPRYWLDFGNGRQSGQVILATAGQIKQPASETYNAIASLPSVTAEYGELLRQSEQKDNTPSCSLAEALEQQDLFINSSLAQVGCSLLWRLFRNGLTPYRGFFFNLENFQSQPIPVV